MLCSVRICLWLCVNIESIETAAITPIHDIRWNVWASVLCEVKFGVRSVTWKTRQAESIVHVLEGSDGLMLRHRTETICILGNKILLSAFHSDAVCCLALPLPSRISFALSALFFTNNTNSFKRGAYIIVVVLTYFYGNFRVFLVFPLALLLF